jgi:hypothetical protein
MAIGNDAHLLYGQTLPHRPDLKMKAIPRNKYLFAVRLTMHDGSNLNLTRIANVAMPSFVYRTQTLNNYNNKSVVQTGIDYTPITLTAYDTKDAVFENFLKKYANHYFTGPMNDDSYVEWLNSPKGFDLKTTNHYIKMMTITRLDTSEQENVIEIFHPFIQNADADTLDYSDSSPTTFRVTLAYEGYRIKTPTNDTSSETLKAVADRHPDISNAVIEGSNTVDPGLLKALEDAPNEVDPALLRALDEVNTESAQTQAKQLEKFKEAEIDHEAFARALADNPALVADMKNRF